MQLMVISSSKTIPNETVLVTQMFEEGLPSFHLRKHDMTTRKMKGYLKAIPDKYHNRIYLHTHHRLALKFNIKGVHLTSKHKRLKWRTYFNLMSIKIFRRNLSISTSFKTLGEVYEEDRNEKYNYVFLSPIFDHTESKFQSGFQEYSLKEVLRKTNVKIIARGGVETNVISKAQELGFDGLAFYSFLWNHPNPIQYFINIMDECRRMKIDVT